MRSIPRRDSKFGNHPIGVVDTAEQVATHVPREILNNFKNHDDGKPYAYEYEAMVIS
jgi:dTDP-4-dehydrorhamnose 3,5-epimerase-like enzyme